MYTKGLVSVVIPNYNYANYVGEAIDSVLSQTYDSIEVIVVDDGSSDASSDVVAEYGDRVTAIFQKNAGVSAARNNGARTAVGEYIAFLDADDIWMLTKVAKQIAAFNEDPKAGLVHVGVAEISANGEVLVERFEGSSGSAVEDLLMLGRRGILGGGSGAMWRREAFDAAGGFDERLSTSADWDIFFQTACRYPVAFVSEILLHYRVHGSNMHGDIAAFEQDMRLAFERAFAACPDAERFRTKAEANLHLAIAGSNLAAGNYIAGIKHSAISLAKSPSNIRHFDPTSRGRNRRGVN